MKPGMACEAHGVWSCRACGSIGLPCDVCGCVVCTPPVAGRTLPRCRVCTREVSRWGDELAARVRELLVLEPPRSPLAYWNPHLRAVVYERRSDQ